MACVQRAQEALNMLYVTPVIFGSGNHHLLIDPIGHLVGLSQEFMVLEVGFQSMLALLGGFPKLRVVAIDINHFAFDVGRIEMTSINEASG